MEIENLLTKNQVNKIIEIINDRIIRFKRNYNDLYYEPYTKMRTKHALTAAVISGFAPDKFEIEGISCRDVRYGLKNYLMQPELSTENCIFHIYSSNAKPLKNNIVQKLCRENNSNINNFHVFFMIIFKTNKQNDLIEINIEIPNNHAKIVDIINIYKRPNLQYAVA